MHKAVCYGIAAVFTAAAVLFGGWFAVRQQNRTQIRKQIQLLEETARQTAPDAPQFGLTPDAPESSLQYRPLYEQNNDFAAWIEIPGTTLSLPVMYTPQDGEYYLYRLFDKTESSYGTPFIDARCSLEPRSDNVIVHGHNMKDDTMFSPLMNYEAHDFFLSHPLITFHTLSDEQTYEIFAVALEQASTETDGTEPTHFYDFIEAQEEDAYRTAIQTLKKRALYETGITPVPGDDLLTLVTCSFYGDNGRVVIAARRV